MVLCELEKKLGSLVSKAIIFALTAQLNQPSTSSIKGGSRIGRYTSWIVHDFLQNLTFCGENHSQFSVLILSSWARFAYKLHFYKFLILEFAHFCTLESSVQFSVSLEELLLLFPLRFPLEHHIRNSLQFTLRRTKNETPKHWSRLIHVWKKDRTKFCCRFIL